MALSAKYVPINGNFPQNEKLGNCSLSHSIFSFLKRKLGNENLTCMVHFQQGCQDPQPNRKGATNISPNHVERLQTKLYWKGKANMIRNKKPIHGGES